MKTCCFDIETTALEGVGAGVVLCVCVRPFATQRTRVFRMDAPAYEAEHDDHFGPLQQEETAMLVDIQNELCKYDLLVGHNINKFDIPYLRTRFGMRGIQSHLWPLTYDTLPAFRRVGIRTVLNCVGKPTASLGHVADYFGIKQEKNGIFPVQHWMAIWGNKAERTEAMDNLVDHCQRDVRMNAAIYPALLELDNRAIIRRLL